MLTYKDVPYSADLVFNAGVVKYKGEYVMLFRNDYGYSATQTNLQLIGRFDGTNLGLATSADGLDWQVHPEPVWCADDIGDPDVIRVYDPRLTVIDDELFCTFAMDTHHGLRGGVARTNDLKTFEIISLSVPDNRNMVLFPERVNGLYARLERPMPVYSRGPHDRFDTWISFSPDLRYWGDSSLVLGVEDVPFANDKVGPAAPPIKTNKGWLTTFHSVDIDRERGKNGWEDRWQKRYCAGVMLLDLEDPSQVLGIYDEPLIAPETVWETDLGFRTNVIFPGGMIPEEDGEVKIYYGASDSVICLATANINELVELCLLEGAK